MNKNISKDKLLGAGIIIGVIIIVSCIIFFDLRKPEKQPVPAGQKEAVTEEEPAAKVDHTMLRSIFPTNDEAKNNLKSQLERQQVFDKAVAEKKQIMAEVRKDVEASLSEQAALTAEESAAIAEAAHAANGPQPAAKQVTTTFADEQKKLMLQKDRIAALKNKELFIHH